MDAGIHANHCMPIQITAQYSTAEYSFKMTDFSPTALTTRKTMVKTEVTTIVDNRKSWRVESIAIGHSSIIILLIILHTHLSIGYPCECNSAQMTPQYKLNIISLQELENS